MAKAENNVSSFARFNDEHDWRQAIDWPAVLAGVLIDDEPSKIRLASHCRSGVRMHLGRSITDSTLDRSVEKCLRALIDEVQRDAIQHVDIIPKVLLCIVKALVQRRINLRNEHLVADHVPESSTS